MSSTRNKLATTLIVGASLAGAFVLTEQLTPGIQSLFGSTTGTGATGDQTVQGDPVNYQYGTVQVEVVGSSGKITSITMLQAGATAGREQAFQPLIDAAMKAQGLNFGTLSGATTTTEAFKQSLSSALAKIQ